MLKFVFYFLILFVYRKIFSIGKVEKDNYNQYEAIKITFY